MQSLEGYADTPTTSCWMTLTGKCSLKPILTYGGGVLVPILNYRNGCLRLLQPQQSTRLQAMKTQMLRVGTGELCTAEILARGRQDL